MNLKDVKQTIQYLNLSSGEYAIFGSGTLLALEIIEDIKDLDIVVTKLEYNRLALLLPEKKQGHLIYSAKNYKIEIFDSWMGLDIQRLINSAIIVNDMAFANLTYVLLFKQVLNRKKDIDHINKIRNYLSLNYTKHL